MKSFHISIILFIIYLLSCTTFTLHAQCALGPAYNSNYYDSNLPTYSCGTNFQNSSEIQLHHFELPQGKYLSLRNAVINNTYCFSSDSISNFIIVYDVNFNEIASGLTTVCTNAVSQVLHVQVSNDATCSDNSECVRLYSICTNCPPSPTCLSACSSSPSNDNCIDAFPLTIHGIPYTGTTQCANGQQNMSSFCSESFNDLQQDLWYKLTIPASGNAIVKVEQDVSNCSQDEAYSNLSLSILSGTCNSLTEIACRQYAYNDSIVLTNLNDGDELLIRVWSEAFDYVGLYDENIEPCAAQFNIRAFDTTRVCNDLTVLSGQGLYGVYRVNDPLTVIGSSSSNLGLSVFSNTDITLGGNAEFLARPNFCADIEPCYDLPTGQIPCQYDVCINHTNDSGSDIVTSIQNAVNNLFSVGGGSIYVDFGADTLLWKDQLRLKSNVHLITNPLTVYKEEYTSEKRNMLKIGDGNGDAPTGSSNVTVNGGTFISQDSLSSVFGVIIEVFEPFSNVVIENVNILRPQTIAFNSIKRARGIRFRGGINGTIRGCTFSNLVFDIMTLTQSPTTQVKNFSILNNNANLHYDSGVKPNIAGGGFLLLQSITSKLTMTGNIINGYAKTELGGHLYASTANADPYGVEFLQDSIYITNNIFNGGTVNAASVGQPNAILNPDELNGGTGDVIALRRTKVFEIAYNTIINSGEYSITTTFGSKNGRVHHNSIARSDGAAIVIGVGVHDRVENIQVDSNYIYRAAMDREGITCDYDYINCTENQSGCNCNYNAWHSVRIWNVKDCSFTYNVLDQIESFGLYVRDDINFTHDFNSYSSDYDLDPREQVAWVNDLNLPGNCSYLIQANNLTSADISRIINDCPPTDLIKARNRLIDLFRNPL